MNISPRTRQAKNQATGVWSCNEPVEYMIGFPRPAHVLASEYTHAAAANATITAMTAISDAVLPSARSGTTKFSNPHAQLLPEDGTRSARRWQRYRPKWGGRVGFCLLQLASAITVEVVNHRARSGRALVALAAIAVVISGCGVIERLSEQLKGPAAGNTTTTTTTKVAPVAPSAIADLLLSVDDVNAAMGTTGIPVKDNGDQMYDDGEHVAVSDQDCLFTVPAEDKVYAGSGWTAVRVQDVRDPELNHRVVQAVVAFPSAADAQRFFTASAQRWSNCSNRQYHYLQPGKEDAIYSVSPLSNTNGTLSASRVQQDTNGWTCHSALTTANNIAVDVEGCSFTGPDDIAVNIAQQIAAKVARA